MADKEWRVKEPKKRFINPYNFVSLDSEVQRTKHTSGTLTGKIKVNLIVKTPLAVPDSESVIECGNGHKVYDFFRIGDTPVIPGSQLRGMIRNAYETLSNSCLSVNNNNILSARHTNAGNPGLVQYKNKEWHLFKATKYVDNRQFLNETTDVRRTWYSFKSHDLKTWIFSNTNIEVPCVNLEKAIDNYRENIKIYDVPSSDFDKNKVKITYGIEPDGRLHPVFYDIVEYNGENYIYLSPSQIGRYVFDNRLDDLLESHISCSKKDGDSLCKACDLFGMIPTDKNSASHAGKLRFSDALPVDFESMGKVTLKELSSPKITSVEFYTKRPENARYWTYDYKIMYNNIETKNPKKGKPKMIIVPNKEKCYVEVRGRKFYLHNPNLRSDDYQITNKTKINSTIELCKPNSRFSFNIYFDKITEDQLRELLWAVSIGENTEESQQMHKLGHGKPLGLGSVKLVAEQAEIRTFIPDSMTYNVEIIDCKKINKYIADNPFDAESTAFKEYMQITNFNGVTSVMNKEKANISYPIADDGKNAVNSTASHQWFIANRSIGEDGSSTSWSAKYVLPKITSKNPTLPAMEKKGKI